MRIALPFFLLAFLAGPALAEWKLLYDSPRVTRYADPETITIDAEGDGYRTASILLVQKLSEQDFQKLYPNGERSSVSIWEYDCKRNRHRQLANLGYSGRMGDGKLVDGSSDVTMWFKHTGNPGFESVARFVCER